MWRAREKGRE
jgi:hypothetical protein